MSFHKGIYKSLQLSRGKSTERLESFCEKLEHKERVIWLREQNKYYEKFFKEHPEYKETRWQSELSYSESIKSRPIIEGYEVESNFGPTPPEP